MSTSEVAHFVYPYIIPGHPAFGWELLYSIRSIYKNFRGPFDITVIGEIPDWIDSMEVRCIMYDNSDPKRFPRVQTRTNQKYMLAADMYDSIIVIHDDQYLIQECDLDDFKNIRYFEPNLNYNGSEKGLTRHQQQIRWTYFKLKDLDKRYRYNFCNHAPFYFRVINLKRLTMYLNLQLEMNSCP
jgi:hypothetical protein